MRKLLFVVLQLIIILSSSAQKNVNKNHIKCQTMEALEGQLTKNSAYTKYYNAVRKLNTYKKAKTIQLEPVVVPVAFHFSSGAISCNQIDCLIEEVEYQLKILNEAFADNSSSSLIQNCPAAYQNANGNSVISSGTNISFCFATPPGNNAEGLDPYCDLPITIGEFNGSKFSPNGNGAPGWDNILNIFIIDNFIIDNEEVLGVSDGIPGQAKADGVTINAIAFGNTDGTRCNLGTNIVYNLGKTLVHEIGHYFGLYHTFESLCNNNPNNPRPDNPGPFKVNDTPLMERSTAGCPSSCINSCDGPVATANFMDYTNDACMGVFSKDQALVMNYWANKIFGEHQYNCSSQNLTITNTVCDNTNTCDVICPTVVTNSINAVEEFCGYAENLSFPNPRVLGINFNNNANGEVFIWSTNNYLSQGGVSITEPFDLSTADCLVATQTYYLNIDCYNNPLPTTLDGGTYEIQVYPLPPDNISSLIEITNENSCSGPTITAINNCENYITITPSNTNPIFPVNQNESGTVSYTINYAPIGDDEPGCCDIPELGGEILENGDLNLGATNWVEIEELPPGTIAATPYGIIGVSTSLNINMNGTVDAWMGGLGIYALTAIEQSITIPQCDTLSLQFDYKTFNCTATNDIEFAVYLNNIIVATLNCSNNTDASVITYEPISIPVNDVGVGDGLIRFEAIESGNTETSILIDNISLIAKDCIEPTSCSEEITASYNCEGCDFSFNLTGVVNDDKVYLAENNITSTATINANVIYQAGEYIMLEKDFSVDKNFDFESKIDECN